MRRKTTAAFTLVELLISMSLLALVSSAVILFVMAMSGFSARNSAASERLTAGEAIRKETDVWFSVLDLPETTFSVPGGDVVIRADVGGEVYEVRRINVTETEGGALEFIYPEHIEGTVPKGKRTETVDAACVKSISFLMRGEGTFPEEEGEEFLFPVATRVVPRDFLCRVIYF